MFSGLRVWEIVKSVNESRLEFFECFLWLKTHLCVHLYSTSFELLPFHTHTQFIWHFGGKLSRFLRTRANMVLLSWNFTMKHSLACSVYMAFVDSVTLLPSMIHVSLDDIAKFTLKMSEIGFSTKSSEADERFACRLMCYYIGSVVYR